MQLPLTFENKLTIKSIRSNVFVILFRKYFLGITKIYKPEKNILHQETVLEKLFDQMLLVEGFYGIETTIDILTTRNKWLILWFPEDH